MTKEACQYGDFQTPPHLAAKAVGVLKRLGFAPSAIIEPTCGKGSFLKAAHDAFPSSELLFGLDINLEYIQSLSSELEGTSIKIERADFFTYDWDTALRSFPDPVLILGNPPWVTNADLGTMGSKNLPEKSNFQGRKGLEALTGKSNFDISEWMLLKNLEWLEGRKGMIAVLCKTATARKVLSYAWKREMPLGRAKMFKIDTLKEFHAAVDACFFIVSYNLEPQETACDIYRTLDDTVPEQTIGYQDGNIVSDIAIYQSHRHFLTLTPTHTWRSGIKHDCSKVMELDIIDGLLKNGFGDEVSIESEYLYPLYKSSDISNGHLRLRKYVIVTQRKVGDDTKAIAISAPKTWDYLLQHSEQLDKRGSSIYKNKPQFSIFGIGDYSFMPWKVAISGFYKKLNFKVIHPLNNKPCMVDDTVYFLGCSSEHEARAIADVLNSDEAQATLGSMIFWDDKRPITVDILKRLNLFALMGHRREMRVAV